jgi:predicted RNA binding protein YcfA (HicA-like mRNA interferase family)
MAETNQSLPVPIHANKDLKEGTYKSILKMAGIELSEVLNKGKNKK